MSIDVPGSEFDVPVWLAVVVVVLFAVTLAYGVVIMGSLLAPIAAWIAVFGLAVILFVVYLLYRFVLAVETIAENV